VTFPIQNNWKQEDALSPLFFNFAIECNLEGLDKPGWLGIKWYTPASGLC